MAWEDRDRDGRGGLYVCMYVCMYVRMYVCICVWYSECTRDLGDCDSIAKFLWCRLICFNVGDFDSNCLMHFRFSRT